MLNSLLIVNQLCLLSSVDARSVCTKGFFDLVESNSSLHTDRKLTTYFLYDMDYQASGWGFHNDHFENV